MYGLPLRGAQREAPHHALMPQDRRGIGQIVGRGHRRGGGSSGERPQEWRDLVALQRLLVEIEDCEGDAPVFGPENRRRLQHLATRDLHAVELLPQHRFQHGFGMSDHILPVVSAGLGSCRQEAIEILQAADHRLLSGHGLQEFATDPGRARLTLQQGALPRQESRNPQRVLGLSHHRRPVPE